MSETHSNPPRRGSPQESSPLLPSASPHHHHRHYDHEAAASNDISNNNNNNDASSEETTLHRGLQPHHLSMLGIAGSIGTGLFLGLGHAIRLAGPLGSLLAYLTVGLVVCAVQFALGEVAALMPLTGGFVRHAEVLIDPAWAFATGWNLVYGNALSIPSEITAVCVLVGFWAGDGDGDGTAVGIQGGRGGSGGEGGAVGMSVGMQVLVILIFIALTVLVGFSFVRIFGEVEYYFALLKIALVISLILLGLIIDFGLIPGSSPLWFKYWHDPGPFVEFIATGPWGRFLGYWNVMTGAVFSFAGVESIAMAAAETKNPREAIPMACKKVFVRLVVFYMLATLVVGMLVSSDDARLDNTSGSAAQSPFVIAASTAGIPFIASIVNAVVITSAWSASNQCLLAGTRVLYGLALKGQAPKVFLRTTSWGTPYMCVLLFAVLMFLSLMSLSRGALTAFWWLVELTAAGVLVSWSTILLNHVRLKMAMRRQGIPTESLPWHNSWTSRLSLWRLRMKLILVQSTALRLVC